MTNQNYKSLQQQGEIEAWLAPTSDEQDLTDAKIVAAVNRGDTKEEEPEEIDNTRITHSEATKILDEALRYVEVQEDATASDVLLFKRWRDKAALKTMQSLKTK